MFVIPQQTRSCCRSVGAASSAWSMLATVELEFSFGDAVTFGVLPAEGISFIFNPPGACRKRGVYLLVFQRYPGGNISPGGFSKRWQFTHAFPPQGSSFRTPDGQNLQIGMSQTNLPRNADLCVIFDTCQYFAIPAVSRPKCNVFAFFPKHQCLSSIIRSGPYLICRCIDI